MFHLKIVLIGPCQSGKTVIANVLSDSSDNIGGEYRPTQGVRIVEFETSNASNKGMKAEVELWDCSGDLKFQSCWTAMYKDAHGVVFVYNPTTSDIANKLDHYYDFFVNQNSSTGIISNKNCLVMEHRINNESQPVSLSNNFGNILKISVNVEENSEKLRSDFSKYITSLLSGVRHRNEQDELNILTVS